MALALPLLVLVEVNYPLLRPESELALFALGALVICFLGGEPRRGARRAVDLALAAAGVVACCFVVVQSQPAFAALWLGGQSLGDRAGAETGLDLAIGVIGLVAVLAATRRALGWVLPALALVFVAYARFGASLPDVLLPHRGYGVGRIVSQTFLHSQGVFGVALRVMFTYVFLFVVFGALLEATGATRYIIQAARRLLGRGAGGPAKVAVAASGLMGSLSGSAVANTATTGTFTIPLMRSSGFAPHVAAGIEAAASSGGALVPPVMGAGAYMMLEIISPPVTYLEIIRAALLPAILYYVSIFLIVHLTALRLSAAGLAEEAVVVDETIWRHEGLIFCGSLATLVAALVSGFSVFRSVTAALLVTVGLAAFNRRTRIGVGRLAAALAKASAGAVPLVTAAASVGVIIGVVTLTGVGTRLPAIILPLAQEHLILALVAIMISSIVLGMGLPSAVCYLLMATLIGPVLGRLGVVPLAAHLFIFYFGMMSMVTPPVALAAYTASSIAGSSFLRSSNAAFRFALVGFTLPFLFVFRPALLMLGPDGGPAPLVAIALAAGVALTGIVPLAAAISGHLGRPLTAAARLICLAAAALLLYPGGGRIAPGLDLSWWNVAGAALFATAWALAGRRLSRP